MAIRVGDWKIEAKTIIPELFSGVPCAVPKVSFIQSFRLLGCKLHLAGGQQDLLNDYLQITGGS